MTVDQIAALAAGIPTIITAITGLVVALRAKRTAIIAQGMAIHAHNELNNHIYMLKPGEESQ
jgi:GTP cyclohydrolase III